MYGILLQLSLLYMISGQGVIYLLILFEIFFISDSYVVVCFIVIALFFLPICSIYKSLGCPHGCGDGLRGRHGDLLRQKGHNCLLRLQKMNPPMFSSYMKEAIKTRPIQELVDFFHAFLGFCVDPALVLQSQQSKLHCTFYPHTE